MKETLRFKQPLAVLLLATPFFAYSQMTLTIAPDGDCSKDATVWFLEDQSTAQGMTNTSNYGESAYLTIAESTWSGAAGRRYALLDFPGLKNIPQGAQILEAKLSLFYASGGDIATHTGDNAFIISRITENWQEDLVNWNNQAAFSTQNEIRVAAATTPTQSFEDIDIRALVSDYINNGNSNGFLLRMETSQPNRALVFASGEHPTPALRPRLVVRFVPTVPAIGDQFSEIFDSTTLTILAPCETRTVETLDAEIPIALGYLWQDGSTESTFEAVKTGVYAVAVSLPDCQTLRDTIQVIFDAQCCTVKMPSAFTPNNDGRNDSFVPVKPENCTITQYQIQIFNRWGKKVYEGNDANAGWDGRDGGNAAPSDVYVYWLKYTAIGNDNEVNRSLKGDITLVR